MECLIGVAFKDFVVLASDKTNAYSLFVVKDDEEKLFKISDKLVMAIAGESGDTVQFAEFISKNIQLYKMRNGYSLSPKAAAVYTRRNLADYLRSRTPYNVNMLIGGYSEDEGAKLFFIDYLASLMDLPYACHGYGGLITVSILDRYYRENMTQAEAYELIKMCVREIHKRLVINLANFKVQVISKDGIKDLPDITIQSLASEPLPPKSP
ncbi:unnamed protein product [Bemisia tabaci]|uniref:Proteasome subunit beta n=1 Tax=Bemisia tabaci TaxID=7038 RepID=A0A9N9ZZG3_BEMTA|nr:PREDICTED: proteasome subunit beta type-2-like [Bemisia tabaci]CAH0382958.1 unnamed protein product [Bemisia tabaci]